MKYMQVYKVVMETKIVVPERVAKCIWNGGTNAHSLAAGAPKESLYSLDKYSAIFQSPRVSVSE